MVFLITLDGRFPHIRPNELPEGPSCIIAEED